jgi:hypothetical protein
MPVNPSLFAVNRLVAKHNILMVIDNIKRVVQVGLIRPDVMSELMKYPEVFFIRDIPKSEKIFEVCREPLQCSF